MTEKDYKKQCNVNVLFSNLVHPKLLLIICILNKILH